MVDRQAMRATAAGGGLWLLIAAVDCNQGCTRLRTGMLCLKTLEIFSSFTQCESVRCADDSTGRYSVDEIESLSENHRYTCTYIVAL